MLSLTSGSPSGPLPLGACLQAGLRVGAVVEGPQAGGEAHVAGKRVDILLIEVRLSGLPAKSSEDGFLLRIIPDPVRASGDAVFALAWASALARIASSGMASSKPRPIIGGATRAEKRVSGVHRAVAQLGDVQARLAQFHFGAVLEANRHRRVVDAHLAFRRHAGHGHVLELPAVDRLRHHAELLDDLGIGRRVGNRQAYQHRHGIRASGVGG